MGGILSVSIRHWKRAQAPHSNVKSEIVARYLPAWGEIVGRQPRVTKLVYLDLYAGRGEHEGGEPSTPLKVLSAAVSSATLRKKLRIMFNDVKKSNCDHLSEMILQGGYDRKLTVGPKVLCTEVGEPLAELLDSIKLLPTFCFLDPYGFKGLTRRLIHAVLKDTYCDCLVFLYTSGISRNLRRDDCKADMVALFGGQIYSDLLKALDNTKLKAPTAVVEAFSKMARKAGARLVLPMQFNFPQSLRVSHHLVFLTKHPLGFHIMKEVMARYSHTECDIPKYLYIEGLESPAEQMSLGFVNPEEYLRKILLKLLDSGSLSVEQIVRRVDEAGLLYLEKNVKRALRELVELGKLSVVDPKGKNRKKNTMADRLIVERTRD